jgi:hypothetical protein
MAALPGRGAVIGTISVAGFARLLAEGFGTDDADFVICSLSRLEV